MNTTDPNPLLGLRVAANKFLKGSQHLEINGTMHVSQEAFDAMKGGIGIPPKSTGDALKQACLANPDDDTAQLVYADWLQENGNERVALNIRTAVRLRREERWRITVTDSLGIERTDSAHGFQYGVTRGTLELLTTDPVPFGALGSQFGPVLAHDRFGHRWLALGAILSQCVRWGDPQPLGVQQYRIVAETCDTFTRLPPEGT